MDASDGSLIAASIRNGRHKRELGRSLPGDSRGDLRAEARGILPKRCERLGHRALRRYDDVHQQVSAVRRRRNVFDEQIVQAVIGMSICQREIQSALDLSAELPGLAFGLPA